MPTNRTLNRYFYGIGWDSKIFPVEAFYPALSYAPEDITYSSLEVIQRQGDTGDIRYPVAVIARPT